MALPSDSEISALFAGAALAAGAAFAVWAAGERGISISNVFTRKRSATKAEDDVLPREKLIGLLKSCATEAEAALKGLKKAYEAETNAAMQYQMMGRQPPPRTPLPALYTAIYSRQAENIMKASGVSEEKALASLEHWSASLRDKEVRAWERRVLSFSPIEGLTAKTILKASQATMDAEFELWAAAAQQAEAAGFPRGTEAFSSDVRRRMASMESASQQYVTDCLVALGAPWTPARADLWQAILMHFVQTSAEVQAATEPALRAQDRRVAALGVIEGAKQGGVDGGDGDEGDGGMMDGMDPQLAAMLMQAQGGR